MIKNTCSESVDYLLICLGLAYPQHLMLAHSSWLTSPVSESNTNNLSTRKRCLTQMLQVESVGRWCAEDLIDSRFWYREKHLQVCVRKAKTIAGTTWLEQFSAMFILPPPQQNDLPEICQRLNCQFQRKKVICRSGIPPSRSCRTFNNSIMASFTSLYRRTADYVISCAHTKFDGSLQRIFPPTFVCDLCVYLSIVSACMCVFVILLHHFDTRNRHFHYFSH